jgi:MEMO1 family protein
MDAGIVYGCLAPHPPILVPAVAGHRVQQVCQTREAMQKVATDIRTAAPDVVVVISPHASFNAYSMGIAVSDSFTGGFEEFGAADVVMSAHGDSALVEAITSSCESSGVPLARIGSTQGHHVIDHGAAVPLFFLNEAGVQYLLVLLSFSGLGVEMHQRFGRAIAAAVKGVGRRAVLIASGDLSHRLTPDAPAGYDPLGKQFDLAIVNALRNGDSGAIFEIGAGLRARAGECGYRSLVVALGAMPEARAEVLSYEAPFGVGYLVARFTVQPNGAGTPQRTDQASSPAQCEDEVAALDLARRAVESYVRSGRTTSAPLMPKGLLARSAGVFVSLKVEGELRGCVGTFQPCEPNVAAEIIRNAVASASRDPRFPPVTRDELPFLSYSIDVLSVAEPVEDTSQLDPRKYGVIVQSGSKKGLLLPDLAGVETVAAQVEIARRKAGISPEAPIRIQRFTVRRIKEARGG